MEQIVQLAGALMILAGFIGMQREWMAPTSVAYLLLNFVGSVALFAVALLDGDWGFVLLEVVWAAVSGWALVKLMRVRLRTSG